MSVVGGAAVAVVLNSCLPHQEMSEEKLCLVTVERRIVKLLEILAVCFVLAQLETAAVWASRVQRVTFAELKMAVPLQNPAAP